MQDNDTDVKRFNPKGAQTPDPLDPLSWPKRYQHRCWALQNLDGDVVLTDNETPSSWIKADPDDAVDLGVMA